MSILSGVVVSAIIMFAFFFFLYRINKKKPIKQEIPNASSSRFRSDTYSNSLTNDARFKNAQEVSDSLREGREKMNDSYLMVAMMNSGDSKNENVLKAGTITMVDGEVKEWSGRVSHFGEGVRKDELKHDESARNWNDCHSHKSNDYSSSSSSSGGSSSDSRGYNDYNDYSGGSSSSSSSSSDSSSSSSSDSGSSSSSSCD